MWVFSYDRIKKETFNGEFLLEIRPIDGKESKIRAHVADIGSRSYDMIIGTDLIQQVECNLIAYRDKWCALIGGKQHIVTGSWKSNSAMVS